MIQKLNAVPSHAGHRCSKSILNAQPAALNVPHHAVIRHSQMTEAGACERESNR
jgi:hypothetical protein